ncbi:hypothetical protein SmJEL517_g04294 [Synchytrium microbalum]|uniref:SEC7 domain-containing protein n=1 Tax=Synchytrium microbalum TaxID=1806994 RepID=A0A507C3S4_9FUNG|nr:uncharacterized protein SmJEL517_g04294 [Synchytrium microbalum]TPX32616.1 hypothetical protein SmJEL517_g04294 [Synchytrium microbalum]
MQTPDHNSRKPTASIASSLPPYTAFDTSSSSATSNPSTTPFSHMSSSNQQLPSMTPRPALSWYHVIHGEIVAVTSEMRKNQRWSIIATSNASATSNNGGSMKALHDDEEQRPMSIFDYWKDAPAHGGPTMDAMMEFVQSSGRNELLGASQEHPLLQMFSQLKARLASVHELQELDPRDILSPFLAVIRSGDATGPITGAALNSLEKFITYGILDPKSPHLPSAMSSLAHAVTHCKFEATDAVSDEVVLDRILRLLRVCVVSEAGLNALDDKGICEMIEAAFGMCFQGRVSELLRRAAEQTLVVIVQALFERLKVIILDRPTPEQQRAAIARASVASPPPEVEPTNETPFAPYGLPAILELLRVLTTLVDPRNRAHTDSVHRAVALGLLATAFEVGGRAIGVWVGRGVRVAARWQGRPEAASHRRQPSTDMVRIAMEAGRSVINVGAGASGGPIETPSTASAENGEPSTSSSAERRASNVRGIATVDIGREVEPGLVDIGAPVTVIEHVNPHPIAPTSPNSPPAEDATFPGHDSGDADQLFDSEDERLAVSAKELITDDLCRFLFQLLLSTNMTITSPPSVAALTLLSLVLRVISSMLVASREHLRLQQEWFLEWVMARVDGGVVGWDVGDWQTELLNDSSDTTEKSSINGYDGKSLVAAKSNGTATSKVTSPLLVGEVRELLLESIGQLARQPTFFSDLYVNYDGNMSSRMSLYEESIRFLSKHSFPDGTPGGPATTSTHQALALESLYLFLHHLVDRRYMSSANGNQTFLSDTSSIKSKLPTARSLFSQRNSKKILMDGAQRFNQDPKDAIRFLQEHKFLPTPAEPEYIATFLKSTPGVNKKLLGEYFGKPANVEVLKAFVKQFEFKGCRIDEALRFMLESFRLPGEAQQIERVMDIFAETYFECVSGMSTYLVTVMINGSSPSVPLGAGDHEIEDQSATFVLAYSVILLNTDQHNPQVRRRMTFEDFVRNSRGINNGKNFSPDYLKLIYEAIKTTEIVMPEEHEGDLGFNYAWKELMKKTDKMGTLISCKTNIYDRDMIMLEYGPMVAALGYALDNAEDDVALQRAVAGFHQLALVAAHYHLSDVFDNVIISLSRITGLLKDGGTLPPPRDIRRLNGSKNASEDSGEVQLKVDRWAVEFGRQFRGQVAAVLMFNLAAESGSCLKEGWKSIAGCLRNLFLHSLLPLPMIQAEDFVRGNITIPRLIPVKDPSVRPPAPTSRRDGILSTFAQLLSLGSGPNIDEDEDAEPTPEDIDAERCTLECIRSCRVEDLFADSRYLEDEALVSLVTTLIEASKSEKISSLRKSRSAPSEPGSPPGVSSSLTPAVVKYHAASIFFLELLIKILIQNRDRLSVVWPVTLSYFTSVLEAAPQGLDPVMLERSVVGLLRLACRLVHKEDMASTVFQTLDLLRSVPAESLYGVLDHTTAGLLVLIQTDYSIFTRYSKWETILSLLTMASTHPEASKYAFEAASALIPDTPDIILTPQNFGECVDLLIAFVTAAGIYVSSNSNNGVMVPSRSGSSSTVFVDDRSSAPSPRNVNGKRGGDGKQHVSAANAQKTQLIQESIDRAIKALDKLYKLHAKIPKFVEKAQCSPERAWFEFWLPVLSGLGQECYHPCREVRQYAMTLLQRALLSSELDIGAGPDRWTRCFDDVLFPLLDELLKPEVASLDSPGVDETRMRASALLCKIFLHSMQRMYTSKGLPSLWTRLLQYLGQFATVGSDYLHEGVLESLKNMLLVMSTQGVFHPEAEKPAEEEQQQQPPSEPMEQAAETEQVQQQPQPQQQQGPMSWTVTWQIVGQFEPNLKDELFPTMVPSESTGNLTRGDSALIPSLQL